MREEEGLSKWDEVIIPLGILLRELTSLTRTRVSQRSRFNTMKIFLSISPPCFSEGRQGEDGGFGGFVWIVFDQTGPLLGSLLTFSIQRSWGASRPSHHYKGCDSHTSVIRESRQGAPSVCVCVSVCVSSTSLAHFSLPRCAPSWNIRFCHLLTFVLNLYFPLSCTLKLFFLALPHWLFEIIQSILFVSCVFSDCCNSVNCFAYSLILF